MDEPNHLQQRSFYARYGPRLVLLLGLLLPLVIWGAKQAAETNNNNIKQWLPRDLPETEVYREFKSHFVTDEFAIVSWDGCTLNDPRLEEFADEVIGQQRAKAGDENGSGPLLFASVTTGPRMVDDLLDAHEDITREEAIERLQGLLIGRESVGVDEYGDDDFTTCVLVKLAPAGDEDRTAAVEALYKTAETIRLDPEQVYMGGDTVSNAALDFESQQAINSLTGFSVIVALVMALIGLRSVRMTFIVFLVAGYSAALAQALVYFTGGQLNLVLVVMPVLVYVLAISSSIHVINYYRDAKQRIGSVGAATRAIADGWLPCTLAAATTAVGLISLSVSRVEPVQRFGQFGALGIIASLAFVFLLLPSLLELRRKNGPSTSTTTTASGESPFILALVTAILRHHRVLVIACAAALVVFGYGVSKINTSVKPMRFYSADSTVMVDARWFEQNLGPLVPIEVVIEFDNEENNDDFFERLYFVSQIRQQIHAMDDVGATISAATYAPPATVAASDGAANRVANSLLTLFGGNATMQRVVERKLRKLFIENQYLAEVKNDDGRVEKELWRITARVEAMNDEAVNDINYDEFLGKIRRQVDLPERVQNGNGSQNERPGVHAAYTGAVPLVYVAQNELLTGLRNSFLMAFLLIGLVMVVLLRSVAAGLISMLPNIFPAVIIFGAMGWHGTVVDVGSMLTASVAMGIAVDDTLHFLTWFRRSVRAGLSRSDAIVRAYQRCAVAMTQTTAIAGLGLLVYANSSFQPVAQFGLLMCLLLVMALVGDLVFLPALLAGRMGALFERRLRVNVVERSEYEETVAEIEQAIPDMEAGRGTSLEQVDREMRDEFGVSKPE